MRRLGIQSDFFSWGGINIDFLAPGFDPESTIKALHDAIVVIWIRGLGSRPSAGPQASFHFGLFLGWWTWTLA